MESGPHNFTFAVSPLIRLEIRRPLPDYISNGFMLVFLVLVVYELVVAFGIFVSWPLSGVFCSGSALFDFTVLRNSNLGDSVRELGSKKENTNAPEGCF